MNAITPIPASNNPKRQTLAKSKARRDDQEFLAPALEILETPASPVALWLIVVFAVFLVVSVAWAYIGRVDIIATAEGKIEPTGRVKTVEPLVTGRVAAIRAQNGDRVMAGDTLVELDATDARAQLDGLRGQLNATAAEVARRQAVLSLVEATTDWAVAPKLPPASWPQDIPAAVRATEAAVAEKDLEQVQAQLASIESQISERSVHERSTADTITAQRGLISTLQRLASMRETLVSKEAGSRADWLSALEALETQQVTLTTHIGEQADDAAAVEVLDREKSKIIGSFAADYSQKLAAARAQADDLAHRMQQAEGQLGQMTLRSPIDGIIQASSLTTIGQVVTTGQELLRVVPVARSIIIQAYLPNEDIGFVHVGEKADVKVTAFPFEQYGTVSGHVVAVGRDAVSSSDARLVAGEATTGTGQRSAGIAELTSSLVFPMTVELEADSIQVGGAAVPLTPGMSVSVEINTGSRRILEFLFAPMVEVTSRAMRER